MNPLRLSARARADLLRARAQAQAAEACGLLVGLRSVDESLVLRAVRVRNRATGERFSLCPGGWMRVEQAARRQGLDVLGPWHSHPDQPAIPSQRDLTHGWHQRPNLIVGTDGIRGWCDQRELPVRPA
ncbi:MAG: Mov34/MPN/PAD-1 family protein [Planctomycetota bacterium]|nr:Mov34/MPN/PAD-1 family protein [Planctomycetota bacterium]